ncbi:hypothetical protein [Natranaerofaba carboxydovora]|uniref:hypothetical protein n=1 Tax=Natranaerofaba carboxydovora TaxID=2742683 RepID=UPI001F13B1EA|nr:hypothetical protein [Natranaerofaba carboxydovora]UMZ74977.1 hypothetical protein ACONDI_02583 [Natranaerofaba carboxydovora]
MTDNIKDKNLESMSINSPELSNEIKDTSLPENREVIDAKNESPSLKEKKEGKEVLIHSGYNPEKEAERFVEGLNHKYNYIVLFGLGLGYHLEAIKKNHPDKNVIIVELSKENIRQAFETRDLSEYIDDRVYFVVSSEPEEAGEMVLDKLSELRADGLDLNAIPSYENLYTDYWRGFIKALKEKQAQKTKSKPKPKAPDLYKNFRSNYKEYIYSPGVSSLVDELKTGFKHASYVFVSESDLQGEVKEETLERLKNLQNLQDKIILISDYGAFNLLADNDITPEFVYLRVKDGIGADFEETFGKKLKEKVDKKELSLLFGLISPYEGVKSFGGAKFTLPIDPFSRWFEDNQSPNDQNSEKEDNKDSLKGKIPANIPLEKYFSHVLGIDLIKPGSEEFDRLLNLDSKGQLNSLDKEKLKSIINKLKKKKTTISSPTLKKLILQNQSIRSFRTVSSSPSAMRI